jgi:hypothetical protein
MGLESNSVAQPPPVSDAALATCRRQLANDATPPVRLSSSASLRWHILSFAEWVIDFVHLAEATVLTRSRGSGPVHMEEEPIYLIELKSESPIGHSKQVELLIHRICGDHDDSVWLSRRQDGNRLPSRDSLTSGKRWSF